MRRRRIRPEWHDENLEKGALKVIMTSSASDSPLMAKHHATKDERTRLASRMRKADDPLKRCIVRDIWLTGFDAPCLHTIYIDKPMKGYNLMQAIARVNRVYEDKQGGLIVERPWASPTTRWLSTTPLEKMRAPAPSIKPPRRGFACYPLHVLP